MTSRNFTLTKDQHMDWFTFHNLSSLTFKSVSVSPQELIELPASEKEKFFPAITITKYKFYHLFILMFEDLNSSDTYALIVS